MFVIVNRSLLRKRNNMIYLLTEEEAKTSKEPCFIWYSFEESVGYFEGTDAMLTAEEARGVDIDRTLESEVYIMIISCFFCGGILELTLLSLLVASCFGCVKATYYLNAIKLKIAKKQKTKVEDCHCNCCSHTEKD